MAPPGVLKSNGECARAGGRVWRVRARPPPTATDRPPERFAPEDILRAPDRTSSVGHAARSSPYTTSAPEPVRGRGGRCGGGGRSSVSIGLACPGDDDSVRGVSARAISFHVCRQSAFFTRRRARRIAPGRCRSAAVGDPKKPTRSLVVGRLSGTCRPGDSGRLTRFRVAQRSVIFAEQPSQK